MSEQRKILIIDDNKAFCSSLKSFVECLGYECLVAHQYGAYQTARNEKPDIVLCDTSHGGIELALKLVEDGIVNSKDNIIGMSAVDENMGYWKNKGFNFIWKSHLVDELPHELSRLVEEK